MTRQINSHPIVGPSATAVRLLHGVPIDAEQMLVHWLDALGAMSVTAWIATGDACARLAVDEARSRIRSVIREQRLEVTAWFIRDMVATAAHGASGFAWNLPRSTRRQFSAALDAAGWAALAIALQDSLNAADVETLCAPFDRVIPRATLRLVENS